MHTANASMTSASSCLCDGGAGNREERVAMLLRECAGQYDRMAARVSVQSAVALRTRLRNQSGPLVREWIDPMRPHAHRTIPLWATSALL